MYMMRMECNIGEKKGLPHQCISPSTPKQTLSGMFDATSGNMKFASSFLIGS